MASIASFEMSPPIFWEPSARTGKNVLGLPPAGAVKLASWRMLNGSPRGLRLDPDLSVVEAPEVLDDGVIRLRKTD